MGIYEVVESERDLVGGYFEETSVPHVMYRESSERKFKSEKSLGSYGELRNGSTYK